jgi:gliding motility-associated-like protein
MQKLYNFSFLYLLIFFISLSSYAQVIPEDDIVPVCDSQTMTMGAPGNTGITNLTIPCNTGQPLSPFMDFYVVRIQSGSTFTFLVDPVGNDDYDFGAWLNPNWNNIAATPAANKRGSQNDPFQTGQFNLGLSMTATDLCETGGSTGNPEPGMVRYFDVQPGDEILIAIDRWSSTSLGYTISFGGDAELDCTILGNSYGKCDIDNNNTEQFFIADFLADLQEDYPTHTFQYYSTQTAAETETGPQVNFPLTVNYNNGDPTEVFVRVENNSGAFVRVLKMFFYVNKLPTLLTYTVNLPLQCDPDLDGQATFDLTASESLFVSVALGINFKYYTTLADANAGGNNNIANPGTYNSGTGQVFVRISNDPQDGNPEGCFRVGTINLEVSDFDVPAQTHTVNPLCDEDGNGFVNVNLNDYLVEFVTVPTDYQISFHLNMADAGTGNNPIPNPTNYAIPAGTNPIIYVRIKSLTDVCYSVSTLQFNTVTRPVLNPMTDVELCVDQQNGDYLFDLSQFNAQVVNNPANFTITYHTTQADADAGANPIPNISAHPLALNITHTIYIRVDAANCPNTTEVEVTINSNPDVAPDAVHVDLCDEDGDGTVIVNLTDNAAAMVNNPANFLITYHTTQADADSGANPIPNPNAYSIPAGQTTVFYIRVQNLLNDCYTTRSISYTTLERPTLNALTDVEECVAQTGNIPYDLTQFAAQIVANPTDYTITYHTSQADADTGANPIANPNAYPIGVDVPTQIFIRVANNGCADSRSVWINLFLEPQINHLPPQVFCTTQQTGTVNYDITQHVLQWAANSTNNLIFSYHTTQLDAENGTNPIANPNAYPIPVGQTTNIYVRVKNQTNDCYVITILTLYPGATATLNTGVEVPLCDDNFDGIYTYTLPQLNAQLVANTAGLTFAYYLTQQNAINGTNPIPQNQWNNYPINSLPFEIWVVAHTTDNCPSDPVSVRFVYGTDITVLTSVIGPVDYCIEDTIDLSSFQNQMTNETGVFFSYHHTLSDAENDINPIANTTQFNPNGNNSVWVRLEKLDRCAVIVEIQFNRLPTPSIELNETYFELCPGSTFEAMATSDDPNATFEWFLGNNSIGTGSNINLTANGTYTIIVTGANGCINETTLTIATPPTPYITGIEYGPDYIIVSANSGDGGGHLEFSLDGVFWQNSPRFDNLIPGESYTVYVREDGCMRDSYEVTILHITNFISPNGDGINDIWEVRGIELSPLATIKIFDRYGKIFVDTNFEGNYRWDGKYLGRPVPSGDYWYIMHVPSDGIVKEQKFMGHISVRNQ